MALLKLGPEANADQIVAAMLKETSFNEGTITSVRITQQGRIERASAVVLDTNLGQKILVYWYIATHKMWATTFYNQPSLYWY